MQSSLCPSLQCQVYHSQRLRDKPLLPWVIAKRSGKILSAHCDFMAGLGDTCSHVASFLWAIEAGVHMCESLTVTQKKAYWAVPQSNREAPYAPLSHIQFTGKSAMMKTLQGVSGQQTIPQASQTAQLPQAAPQLSDLERFLEDLSRCSSKAAILAVLPKYADACTPQSSTSVFPAALCELYQPDHLQLSFLELLHLSDQTIITVRPQQAQGAEETTRQQSKSKLWYRMHSGRVILHQSCILFATLIQQCHR